MDVKRYYFHVINSVRKNMSRCETKQVFINLPHTPVAHNDRILEKTIDLSK